MRGQHPGMPPPQSRQQSGYDDMQLWQQQLMFKQLQELHRQQQIRQSGEDLRQQNLMNQISSLTKQTITSQLPSIVNGVPLHDASSFTWQGEYAGNEMKVLNNSQMPMSSNMNLAQLAGSSVHEFSNGLALSQDQGQGLLPFGLVSQQSDQSLYGLSVSGNRGWPNTYTQLHSFSQPHELSETMSKEGENVAVNSIRSNQGMFYQQNFQDAQLARRQEFPEKRLLGQSQMDGLKNGISTNYGQVNQLGRALHAQEFHAQQDQSFYQGTRQEKSSNGPTSSSISLDPTEQKILFGSDDDASWNAFGMTSNMSAGSYLRGNPSNGSSLVSSFPSFNGGSWSALMQSAVAEVSSNDSGLKEEWSGLNLQKTDVPSLNTVTGLGDTAKPQTYWFNNSLQGSTPSASGPISSFENRNSSTNEVTATGFQPSSAKFPSDHRKAGQEDGPYGSLHQSGDLSSPNVHNPLAQRHGVPSYSSDFQLSSKGDGWISNNFQPSHVKAPYKVSDVGSQMQHDQLNDSLGTLYADKSQGNNMWNSDSNKAALSQPNSVDGIETTKSSSNSSQVKFALGNSLFTKGFNSTGFNEHDAHYGKPILLDSSQSNEGKENFRNNAPPSNKRPQTWGSVPSNSDKVSGENRDREPRGSQKDLSNDSYISTHSHPDSSDSGGASRAGAETHPYVHSNQKFSGQVGQRSPVPQKFQYHPMGNLGFVTEVNEPPKKSLFAHEKHQIPFEDSRNYLGYRQLASTSTTGELDKGCVKDVETTVQGSSQANSNHEVQVPAFFDGSSFISSQSKRTGQTSGNMLELINKVDQSRVRSATESYGDPILLSQRIEPKASEGQISNSQYNQVPQFQGFGLQLGPPFEKSALSNNAMHFPPQTVTDRSLQPSYPDGEEKSGAWPNSTASDQSVHHSHDAPKMDGFDGQPLTPQKSSRESFESNAQAKQMASISSSRSYTQNQLRNQQIFGMDKHMPNNSSLDPHFGMQNNMETEMKQEQSNNFNMAGRVNESSQTSFNNLPGGFSTYKFASSQGLRSSHGLQMDAAMSQSDSPNLVNPGQQTSEQHISLQSSLAQQVGFSGNLHNLWSNINAQRLSNDLLRKGLSSSVQSSTPISFHSPWVTPKVDIQDHMKGQNILSAAGACVAKSQNQSSEEEKLDKDVDFSSCGQETSGNRVSDGSMSMPSQSTVRIKQNDNNHVEGLVDPQKMHQMSNHKVHGIVFRPQDAQNRNYSLLQQIQAQKALEADQHNRPGKRLKGTDFNLESQRHTGKIPQNLNNADEGNVKVGGPGYPADSELSAVVQHGSFPTNSKMLSFCSTVNEGQNAARNPGTEISSQDLSISKPSDFPNNAQSIGNASAYSVVKSIEDAKANSRTASSFVEQHGTFKDVHSSTMHDENGNLKQRTEIVSEHYVNSKCSEDSSSLNAVEGIAASDEQSILVSTPSEGILDQNMNSIPKKRKSSDLLPWHREVTEGSHWLHRIRMAEKDWAHSTYRLVEKVGDEAEMSHDGSSITQSRRRLTLTTHLMQQLMPSLPAAILSQPASLGYEFVTFLVAKLGLGDACSLVSSLTNGVRASSTTANATFGKLKDFEMSGDHHFLKALENFVGRVGKLENDLLRFEKRASMLDVRVECQDLERFSIINRFAKFHGRSQAEGIDSSSETIRKTYPQRFVTATTMHVDAPEGLVCLSL